MEYLIDVELALTGDIVGGNSLVEPLLKWIFISYHIEMTILFGTATRERELEPYLHSFYLEMTIFVRKRMREDDTTPLHFLWKIFITH